MVELLKEDDRKVLSKDGFMKNAVFYKDLFAFYDAYVRIMETDKQDLPSYVFHQNKFELSGICLFMKNYASELSFETIHLTLGYLKTLYFVIASYAEDKSVPERKIFEDEFQTFCETAQAMNARSYTEYDLEEKAYKKTKDEFDKKTSKYATRLVWSKLFNILSVSFLVTGFVAGMIPFSLFFLNSLSLKWAIISSVLCVVAGISVSFVFKFYTKKFETISGDSEYEIQQKKKIKDGFLSSSQNTLSKYSRIAVETYETKHNLCELLNSYKKTESFEKLIQKASMYKLLSFNLRQDIENIIESQTEEEEQILARILKVDKNSNDTKELAQIYSSICEKDWLYYNNEIRFEFIKKFVMVAENSFEWTINIGSKQIDPFGIKIKNIANEKVVFLRNKDDLFVQMPYLSLMKTNLIKSSSLMRVKNIDSAEKFRQTKTEYLTHFFSYQKTKDFDNLFKETKFKDGISVSKDIILSAEQIPLLASIELRVAEKNLGLANPNSPTIIQMHKIIEDYEGNIASQTENTNAAQKQNRVIKNIMAVEEDMLDYTVTYTFDDGSFVGYKLSKL